MPTPEPQPPAAQVPHKRRRFRLPRWFVPALWVAGVPLGLFAVSSANGMGQASAFVWAMVLTVACGLAGPAHSPAEAAVGPALPRWIHAVAPWLAGARRLLWPALGFTLAMPLLGADMAQTGLCGVWFAALLLGWYGAGVLLGALGIPAALRVIVLGSLSMAMASTFFWAEGAREGAGDALRPVVTEWLYAANLPATLANHVFDVQVLTLNIVYMQKLSPLADMGAASPYGSYWEAVGVALLAFVLSGVAAVATSKAWRAQRMAS